MMINCKLVIFIFDVMNKSSYVNMQNTIRKIQKLGHASSIRNKKILIANKIDLVDFDVEINQSHKDILRGIHEQIEYYEISLLNNINTNDVKQSLIDNVNKCWTADVDPGFIDSKEDIESSMFSISEGVCGVTKSTIVYESWKINKNSLLVKTVYKIILLGDEQAGKSSFFKRYFNNNFEENYLMTVGVNDQHKYIKIDNNEIKLQIWDTAGQERFRCLPQKYYKHADGIILMYDITNKESFNNVSKWINDINSNSGRKAVIYLVGNKIDLIEERKVEYADALEFAIGKNIKTVEISCKFNINLDDTVRRLSRDIYAQNKSENRKNKGSGYFKLNDRSRSSDISKSKCC